MNAHRADLTAGVKMLAVCNHFNPESTLWRALRRNVCDCNAYPWQHQRGLGACRQVRIPCRREDLAVVS